jgi:alginate O-acetyltransferase complex protein AlgI
MNFNSLPFVGLNIVTFFAYYAPIRLPHWQVVVLVTASLVFYGWEQPYLLALLLFSAAVTSLTSLAIIRAGSPVMRRMLGVAGVGTMLLVLAFFKYDALIAMTLHGDLDAASGPAHWLLMLPLPIGISFYTFHGISLVVDSFTGAARLTRAEPMRAHAARTLLYLTFFPQLIAGPIMKARDFLPQIGRKKLATIDWDAATRALLVGYFLKMAVADNLAVLTALMTGDVSAISSITLVTLVFAYSCQIFADFAGYSLIAIGLGRLFGYELMSNFNFPYLAQSFADFWHRWNISLSTWLRDYLYIPLGGSRCGSLRQTLNIMIVMFLGGLWHGAAWSYAVWGSVHGLALAIERPFLRSRFYTADALALRLLRTIIVVVFVSLAWLLFRLPNFSQVLDYGAALVANRRIFNGGETFIALIVYSIPVVIYHAVALVPDRRTGRAPVLAYAALAGAICLNSGVPGAFIYFRF